MRKQLNLTEEVCEFLDRNVARHVQGQFVSLAIMKFKNSQIAKSLMIQNKSDSEPSLTNIKAHDIEQNTNFSKEKVTNEEKKKIKSSNKKQTDPDNDNDVDYDDRF